ncbi:rop guanine nucleotide exchange factor 12-like isoform X1 [Cicer arietinum]|uniref:Rop guanine nucleotide exchange factor 12-like isoform X1 n=2 Tax=Cicer arietinum TaxID=3827 RepID=A0A1S2YM24_CICAR|nr:rop guanine nucleotide exchange factor 12-like isoform X1 [Cicer arietinum]
MVKTLEQEQENCKSKLFNFKGMFENTGRHTKSLSIESASTLDPIEDDPSSSRSQGSKPLHDSEKVLPNKSRTIKEEIAAKEAKDKLIQELEQMKERFAKLLLGEDMSGGGKGVSSALALSNALTNLAAAVFGEQKRLEPMAPERKARWRKEIDWLLSVTEYVVEMVPTQQKSKDGSIMEIMTTRQRTDLHMNIPALRKLDTMLIDCLDNFKDQTEFYYVSKDADDQNKDSSKSKNDDKWWLPTPKVPVDGLSEAARRFLQYQKDCVNQVLKAAMAINAQTLSEMEIPESYIESLPKNGRASLGDLIYRSITDEFFDPDQFLGTIDMSSEHKILDLKNRIEASIVIWKRKMNQKDTKSSWGSAVSMEKRELFEERAETILILLKHRFPGLPQSSLDISKIQFNKDVGQAVLESYSRILESLAFTVLSRIEDVLHADGQTQNPSQGRKSNARNPIPKPDKCPTQREEVEKSGGAETPLSSMTLSDFMGWSNDQGESDKKDPLAVSDELEKDIDNGGKLQKLPIINTDHKKMSYLETMGVLRGRGEKEEMC